MVETRRGPKIGITLIIPDSDDIKIDTCKTPTRRSPTRRTPIVRRTSAQAKNTQRPWSAQRVRFVEKVSD